MKTLYKFANATLMFALVMDIALKTYVLFTGDSIADVQLLSGISIFTKIAYYAALLCYVWIGGSMVRDYVYPPLHKTDICQAEVGFTRIVRDDEGEEITRTRHLFIFYHTIGQSKHLDEIVNRYHNYIAGSSDAEVTVENFCDYVNMRTPYLASVSKEELIDRLKNK